MGKEFKKPAQPITAPEMQFISQGTEDKEAQYSAPKRLDVRLKKNPEYVEVKSKRVQLIMQPSLWEAIKQKADKDGVSFNEFCHRALAKTIEDM